MKMDMKLQRLAQSVALGALLVAASACGQTATQFYSGYLSPGTITITNTFSYPVGQQCVGLIWGPIVPQGWTITNVRGNGGGPELGWDGYILFTAYTIPNPGIMMYDVVVPAGETGPKNIEADVYYDLGPGLTAIRATPDPLALENLVKTFQVVSAYGSPTPSVGSHSYQSGTPLSPSVDASVYMGATQYVCTGWTVTGHEPASGAGNSFSMTVTNAAVLTWNWAVDNISPSVEGEVKMTGWRTRANVLPEENLLSHASDPDGDPVTLTSVDTTSAYGGTITRLNGVLTYTPPKLTDAVLDSFTYTVEDGRGGSAKGVVNIKVYYGGSAIRVF